MRQIHYANRFAIKVFNQLLIQFLKYEEFKYNNYEALNKFFLILTLILFQCSSPSAEDVKNEVDKQYNEKKSNLMMDRISQCQRQLYKDAQTIADSVLRIESKQSKLDSIKVPHDTLRPTKPELQFPDYKKPTRDSFKK